jgi:excisionase family DNA binding protein
MINRTNKRTQVFLTSAQAAEFLNISISTLKKFIYLKRVKTLRTPGGHYRILKQDLLAIVNESSR